jgi:hypothetical protein
LRLDRQPRFKRINRVGQFSKRLTEIEGAGPRIANKGAASLMSADPALRFQHIKRVTHCAPANADRFSQQALWRQFAGCLDFIGIYQ